MGHFLQAYALAGEPPATLPPSMKAPVTLRLPRDICLVLEPEFDTDRADWYRPEIEVAGVFLSKERPCAYLVTTYPGGFGGQAAKVWLRGKTVMTWKNGDGPDGPISEALRLLGVERGPDRLDEFEAVGFGYVRNNEDAPEFAKLGSALPDYLNRKISNSRAH